MRSGPCLPQCGCELREEGVPVLWGDVDGEVFALMHHVKGDAISIGKVGEVR